VNIRNISTALALAGLLAATAHAAAPDGTSIKLVELSASMNEMAIACGHMSASDVAAAQAKQRQAMLDQGVSAKDYDKTYATARSNVLKKWESVSKQQQQSSCAQLKAYSDQAAASAGKLEQQLDAATRKPAK
jgi:xylose isomerase